VLAGMPAFEGRNSTARRGEAYDGSNMHAPARMGFVRRKPPRVSQALQNLIVMYCKGGILERLTQSQREVPEVRRSRGGLEQLERFVRLYDRSDSQQQAVEKHVGGEIRNHRVKWLIALRQ